VHPIVLLSTTVRRSPGRRTLWVAARALDDPAVVQAKDADDEICKIPGDVNRPVASSIGLCAGSFMAATNNRVLVLAELDRKGFAHLSDCPADHDGASGCMSFEHRETLSLSEIRDAIDVARV
jgi:hypothetical protein